MASSSAFLSTSGVSRVARSTFFMVVPSSTITWSRHSSVSLKSIFLAAAEAGRRTVPRYSLSTM